MIKITMDSLPCELLVKIINSLSLKEILKCKCVCKKWKMSIDNNLRIDYLTISDQAMTYQKWYFTNQLVDCFYLITKFNPTQLIQPIFKNIKQLYIFNESFICSKNLGMINNLKQLEHLEIINLAINDKNFVLSIPNLIHLNIQDVKFNTIILDTPKLDHLRIISPYCKELKVKFNYPESIKNLELSSYQPIINSLSNLEYFYCREINCNINSKFLKSLPKLKEVHFNQNNRQKYDVFTCLKQHSHKLKRDLKIYNYGLNLVTLPSIKLDDGSVCVNSETTQFICDNYNRLADRVPFINGIDYTTLANHFAEMPSDFSSKFINIYTIRVNGKVNAKDFINFLQNYRNLKCLKLNCSGLKQKFFDILPQLCPNIVHLSINENYISNFNFIRKFKNLYSVDTNEHISCDFLYKVFKTTNIKQFFFFFENEYSAITCDDDNTYKFGLAQDEPQEFSSLEELIYTLKKLLFYELYQKNEVDGESFDEEMSMEIDDEESIIMSQDLNDDNESTISHGDTDLAFSQMSNDESEVEGLDDYLSYSDLDYANESDEFSMDVDEISIIFDSENEDDEGSTLSIDNIEVSFSGDEDF